MTTKPTYEELEQKIIELESLEIERNRVENVLRESEEKYRLLIENINIGVTMIDPDHNIIFTNSAVGKWFDKNPREFVGKKCYQEFEKKNQPCPYCPGIKAMETGQPCEVESEGVRDDGSRFTVRDRAYPLYGKHGDLIGFNEIVEDISEQKMLEESLRASEAELKAIFENSATGITISDLEGHIIRTNSAHQRIFGYSQAELETMTFSDFTHPDDIGNNTELFKEFLGGEIPQLNITKRFIHKNGHTIWTHVKLSLILDDKNNPLSVIGIVEDITERKKEEIVKDALIEKLQKATEEIKSLEGIVPICMHCKQIRDDKGFWNKVENYIEQHTEAKFSHGICPSCLSEFHPDVAKRKKI